MDATLITGALGAAQTIAGLIGGIGANNKIKDVIAQRKAYQTPEEIFQILNATQSAAQGDSATRDFQTGQIDRAFSGAIGTAELLGGDPNSLSALFDARVNNLLKVGEQFHASNMESFGNYLKALNTVADNKAAEQISQDNLLKDQIQALAQQKQDATKNVGSGVNAITGALAADATMDLYKEQTGQGVSTAALQAQIADLKRQLAGVGGTTPMGKNGYN